MKRAAKIAIYTLYVVAGLTAVFFALPQTGWKALVVETGSMAPAIPKESLVLIHSQPYNAITVGRVITYHSPAVPGQTITHRVIAKGSRGGVPTLTTKGDANASADPTVPAGSVVGIVAYHAAGLGRVVNWLHTPTGIILVVGIPGLLIIISEFSLMLRRLQRYTEEETHASAQRDAERQLAALQAQSPVVRRRKPRPLIWVVAAVLILPAAGLAVGSTHAQLSSTAKLLDTTITITKPTTPPSTNPCPNGSTSVSISNTGPGSSTSVTSNTNCTVTSSNNTSVNVSNSSSQTATTGSVSNDGNTNGNGTSSGSATNSSSSQTDVTIGTP